MIRPTREEIVHDLTMACVNGYVMDTVLKANRDYPDVGFTDISSDVVVEYQLAHEAIDSMIFVSDTED